MFESQLPTYFEETSNGSLKLKPEETIYTLWIGTNDLGESALLTGDDAASLVDVTNCMVNWVKVLYESGARNFIFQNVSVGTCDNTLGIRTKLIEYGVESKINPLQHTILYSSTGYYTKFWTFPRNATSWSVSMTELTLSGNDLTQLKLQALLPQIPDAHVGKP